MDPLTGKAGQPAPSPSGPRPPKVSVLIPTYNYARYLPEAIESVLAQDFADYEIVIADNASQDGSREIIQRFAMGNDRIRSQFNETNIGLVPNFNRCLSLARGEYVIFLASDDKFATRDALGKLARMLDENPSATMAVSARVIIDASSKIIESADHLGASGLHPGLDILWLCLERNANVIGEPTAVMLRRRNLTRGFDPQFRQLLDLELWFELLEQGDLIYTREALCSVRRHPAQQTALNHSEKNTELESAVILRKYLAKPWFNSQNHRAAFFSQIYDLRKKKRLDAPALELCGHLMKSLGRGWYAWFWIRHKVAAPFAKLNRSFSRRRQRATE